MGGRWRLRTDGTYGAGARGTSNEGAHELIRDLRVVGIAGRMATFVFRLLGSALVR